MSNTEQWDFFIAHAGQDRELAIQLYDLLKRESRPFLDEKCISLGEDWDAKISSAQLESRTTVVLVSSKTPKAYYQREEIAAALQLSRQPDSSHRVVPVFLSADSITAEGIPYGLRIKHGVILGPDTTLEDVARRLLSEEATTSDGIEVRRAPAKLTVEQASNAVDPWAISPASILRAALGGDAVSRSPSHHWKVAVLFARLRNFSEAIEALEYGDRIASTNDPERPLYAGFVYLRSGRHIEGEILLRQYLQGSNPSNKNAAIAYDLLGSELRRKLAIYEAESRFKSALKLKEKIGDFVGQGITLGNLGRIYLYTMRPVDAVSYFQRNLALADHHCPESEGIARNNLAEAQVVVGQYGRARDVLAPILGNDSRFTARDRGFAQVVLAEAALAEADIQTAKIALRDATNQFERCSEENGLFMVVELEGIVALSNGWMITANRLFRDFDAKLAGMADHLFSIYRWRRRALLASQFGDENVTLSALDQARKNAIRNGLPSDDIDDEMIELRKLAQGLEPPFGTVAWFSYWQSRLPYPVANGLRLVHQHPLGWFRWAEETCEFLEALLLVALDEKAQDVDRLSFGQKVQGFRTMVRAWTGKYTRSRSSWNSVVRSFEELVAMRNRTVHPTDSTVAPTDEEIIGVSRSILHFVARHISIHVSNGVIDIGEDTANSLPEQGECRGIVLDGQKVSIPVKLLRVQESVSETDMAEDLTEPNQTLDLNG